MTVAERLSAAQQKSVSLYLHRQAIQGQIQQLQLVAQQTDLELVALDGEIRVLTALTQESAHGE